MRFLRPLLTSFFELLFPARCQGCDGQIASSRPPLLCPACRDRISRISSPLCTCCGAPFRTGTDRLCTVCQDDTFAFDRARSLFVYEEPLRTLILQLKFNGSLAGISTFAALAEQADITALFHEADLILPVPLHRNRLRQRGFNQSLLLAEACFPAWKNKIRPALLRRHRATVPQTRLNGADRCTNLTGAFSLRDPQKVEGKRILLADDVQTTGSTLNECAKVLAEAGAAEIEAFTVAGSRKVP